MEMLLVALTIVSVAAAVILGGVAWRLARAERARSQARVAALAAAATFDPADDGESCSRPHSEFVPPSAPRLAPLVHTAAPAQHPGLFVPPAPKAAPWGAPAERRRASSAEAVSASFLSGTTSHPRAAAGQRGLAIAAGVLFVALIAGASALFGGRGGDGDGAEATATAPAHAGAAPLELVSLRHERKGSTLAVTGMVRNPTAGTAVDKLAAVVLFFDQQGSFVTSARADVDYRQLPPGDESPFVVTTAAPGNVARYRVSFRTDAGVVPHIDRRGQAPLARDMP